MEQQDLRTLQGEKVKSYEELQIANWLYENGIEYEYEPIYEHNCPRSGRRDYCPDFRLTESGVYIEHFGVRRQKMPDGSERLITAPFVDRDEYLAGMDWKRKVHAEHGTTLIETYSYERQEGRLLVSLAEKLAPHVTTEAAAQPIRSSIALSRCSRSTNSRSCLGHSCENSRAAAIAYPTATPRPSD